MRVVSVIEGKWLLELAPHFYQLSTHTPGEESIGRKEPLPSSINIDISSDDFKRIYSMCVSRMLFDSVVCVHYGSDSSQVGKLMPLSARQPTPSISPSFPLSMVRVLRLTFIPSSLRAVSASLPAPSLPLPL